MAAAAPAAQDEARAAIRQVIAQTEAANNAGDVDAWLALFAPDAVYMAPGAPAVTTPEALRDVARTGFANRAAIRIVAVEIVVTGDWAFARTTVTGNVTLRDSGKVIPVDNKQIVVYRRQPDGAWKIARMISNSNR